MPKLTNLTKSYVDEVAIPVGKAAFHWDDRLKGFGLVVRPSGAKSWIIQYRAGGGRSGRSRRMSLGQCPPVTPHKARERAVELLAAVARGEDPAADRAERREAPSVNEICKAYLSHLERRRKASTLAEVTRLFKRRIADTIGPRRVDSVTREDIVKLHRQIGDDGAPIEANRLLTALRAAWNNAERDGLVRPHSNPVRLIERNHETRRTRFMVGEEIVRLGEALERFDATERHLPTITLAIRLLLLTGMRQGEVLNMRWEDIDFDRSLVRLEDSKTGPQTRPISGAALRLLAEAPRLHGNSYVCWGGRKGTAKRFAGSPEGEREAPRGRLVGLQKAWEEIRRLAEIEDVRLHDLRHTFASAAADAGYNLLFIGAMLGHADQATTKRYAHLVDPARHAAHHVGQSLADRLLG